MNIAIIGSGYVGTVTGTCLAELGHQVVCADINEARIAKLSKGLSPLFEDGLEPLLRTNLDEGRLRFTTDIQSVAQVSDIIFLCVGTNSLPSGKPDMKPLARAVEDIARMMEGDGGYKLIVEKSTYPVKTVEWLKDYLKSQLPAKAQFDVVVVPQFLREGKAVQDFMHPDRIVIGSDSQRATDQLVGLYRPLGVPLLVTDTNSAELIKHATNAFLAMKISFINMMAQICEETGADIELVSKGLGLDKRISPDFLNAGIGYGGVFFPKDIASLVNIAEAHHINLDLLKTVEVINRYQRISFVEKIAEALGDKNGGGKLEGKTIALWGLAYRPHTDDLRDAPSVSIIRSLQKRGAKVRAYDPLAMDAARELMPELTYCKSPYQAAEGADAIAILTEWEAFKVIDFKELKKHTQSRILVDGRNMYNPQRMCTLGFNYYSIGRQALLCSVTPPGGPSSGSHKPPATPKKPEKVAR